MKESKAPGLTHRSAVSRQSNRFGEDFKRDAVRLVVDEKHTFPAAAKAVGATRPSWSICSAARRSAGRSARRWRRNLSATHCVRRSSVGCSQARAAAGTHRAPPAAPCGRDGPSGTNGPPTLTAESDPGKKSHIAEPSMLVEAVTDQRRPSSQEALLAETRVRLHRGAMLPL